MQTTYRKVAMKQRSDPSLFGVLIYQDVEPIDIGGTVGVVSMRAACCRRWHRR
jgi:hypothetical protein